MSDDRDSHLLYRDDAPPVLARSDAEAEALALIHDVRNLLTPLVHCAAILRHCSSDPGRIERISDILERNVQGLNHRLEVLLDPPAARQACELHAEQREPGRRRMR